jgi:hypothetical protein
LIHRCNCILLSQVYCIWQDVKTPTIISNNPYAVYICVWVRENVPFKYASVAWTWPTFPLCVYNHTWNWNFCIYWANNAQNKTTIIVSTFNYTVLKASTLLKNYTCFRNRTRIIISAKWEQYGWST